jgi:phospholipid/cholesterol/gamma-HCH transport system substrate-binding protein
MDTNIETRARVAFVLVLLLCAVAGLAWYFFAAGRYATFQIRTQEPVSGLIADAPVELHGVEVGKVTRVELRDARSVEVLLSIRKDAPISAATVATITGRGLATRGFTGYVYVSLEDTGSNAGPLVAPPGSPFPVIPTAASRSVNLDTAISQLSENVQSMSALLQSVLDTQTVASLKQSLESLRRVTQTLASNNEKLGSILASSETLLQSSNDTVRALRTEVLPQTSRTLATLDKLASAQFAPLLQSSSDVVNALQTQVLPQAYRALTRLDDLSTSLGDVATKLKRDPSVLVRGSALPPPGPGETR